MSCCTTSYYYCHRFNTKRHWHIYIHQSFCLSLTLIIGITSKLLLISIGTQVILCNYVMILFSCLSSSSHIISGSLSTILPSHNLTLFTHYGWYKVVKYYMIFHLLISPVIYTVVFHEMCSNLNHIFCVFFLQTQAINSPYITLVINLLL